MEDESAYEYSDDEVSTESEEEDLQEEVDFHIEIKKNAYDRYMEMLLKKAFEKVIEEVEYPSDEDEA